MLRFIRKDDMPDGDVIIGTLYRRHCFSGEAFMLLRQYHMSGNLYIVQGNSDTLIPLKEAIANVNR